MADLTAAIAAIDAANSHDPNLIRDRPRALFQGELASQWLDKLTEHPSDALSIAVRAHHLKRWEVVRADYPEGRAGYLRWRKVNKQHQADQASGLARSHGFDQPTVNRVAELLYRHGLGSDPETQILEDAACLVFLQTQFDDLTAQLDRSKAISAVAKTLKKMSPRAIDLASGIALAEPSDRVLEEATRLNLNTEKVSEHD